MRVAVNRSQLEHRLTAIEAQQKTQLITLIVGGGATIATIWAVAVAFAAVVWRLGSRVGAQNGRVGKLEEGMDRHVQEIIDKDPWGQLAEVKSFQERRKHELALSAGRTQAWMTLVVAMSVIGPIIARLILEVI